MSKYVSVSGDERAITKYKYGGDTLPLARGRYFHNVCTFHKLSIAANVHVDYKHKRSSVLGHS